MRFNEIPNLNTKQREHFLSLVNVADKDLCWEWQGGTDGRYGKIGVGPKEYKAHRIAYFIFNGVKPNPERDVCHRCDNPPCCNPSHLFEGTRQENLLDCIAKGRKVVVAPPKGDANPLCKLSDKKVQLIRRIYTAGIFGTNELANHFSIARSLVHRIIDGKSRAVGESHIQGLKKYGASRVRFYLQAVHPNTYVQIVKNSRALKGAGYVKYHYGYTLFLGTIQRNYMSVAELKRDWKLTDEMVDGHALNWLKNQMEF